MENADRFPFAKLFSRPCAPCGDPETPAFREIALPEDITYACLSDRLLIRRGDGTIQWAGD